MKKRYLKSLFKRGFTLPELIICVGIISLIAAVVVYNHKKFDSNLELTNVAYRLAVSIRQAQVYGISVREFGGDRFDVPYGINFYSDIPSYGQPPVFERLLSYVFFADSNPNPSSHGQAANVYNGPGKTGCVGASGGTPDECIERVTLGRGNKIRQVCASNLSSANGACLMDTGNIVGTPYTEINSLSIVFKRPKSDAIITFSQKRDNIDTPLPPIGIFPITRAVICIESADGTKTKLVTVGIAGQISVSNPQVQGQCY